MTTSAITQISQENEAVNATVAELGNALDRAEASDPTLRPRDADAFAVRPLAPWERGVYVWQPPQHPAVRAYWRALHATIDQQPPDIERDLPTCRRTYRAAWTRYSDLTIQRDSGCFVRRPSLRAILDARAAVIDAYTILEQAKYRRDIERANLWAAARSRGNVHYPKKREKRIWVSP